MTSPPTPEPDPFKNARGLSAMFAKRSGPPLWPFLLAAVVIIGFVGLRVELATREDEARDASMRLDEALADQHRSESIGAGMDFGGAPTSPTELKEKAQRVCAKLGCAGGAAADSIIADCVRQNDSLADDPLSRSMLGGMLDGILTACGDKSCAEFEGCYFDHLKAASGVLGAPSTPVSDDDRKRVKELVCQVAIETPGHLPDINSPNASPKALELNRLIQKIGPVAASDLMKGAVDECSIPTPSTSGSAANALR